MKQNESFASRVFDVVNVLVMFVIIAICIYPLIYLISKSLSSVEFVRANMVYLLPRGFNIDSYKEDIKERTVLDCI